MSALVIYESMYGNTHAVADAIAEGLGDERRGAARSRRGRPARRRRLPRRWRPHPHARAQHRAEPQDGGQRRQRGRWEGRTGRHRGAWAARVAPRARRRWALRRGVRHPRRRALAGHAHRLCRPRHRPPAAPPRLRRDRQPELPRRGLPKGRWRTASSSARASGARPWPRPWRRARRDRRRHRDRRADQALRRTRAGSRTSR